MKLYKKLLVVITLFIMGTGLVYAQNGDDEVYPQQAGINHNDAVKEFSREFATTLYDINMLLNIEHDTNNRALINQRGDNNTAVLTQYGYGNTGIIDMLGNDNETFVTQTGNFLLSLINMEGNANYLNFDQYGNNRGAFFLFRGDNINYDVQQFDSQMQLTPLSASDPSFHIQHTGQMLPVIITKN